MTWYQKVPVLRACAAVSLKLRAAAQGRSARRPRPRMASCRHNAAASSPDSPDRLSGPRPPRTFPTDKHPCVVKRSRTGCTGNHRHRHASMQRKKKQTNKQVNRAYTCVYLQSIHPSIYLPACQPILSACQHHVYKLRTCVLSCTRRDSWHACLGYLRAVMNSFIRCFFLLVHSGPIHSIDSVSHSFIHSFIIRSCDSPIKGKQR